MKILITGTHSTGKSTLLGQLKLLDELSGYKFIGGITREAKSFGLEINENGGDLTQLYCMSSDFLNLIQNEDRDVVYDRSILDTAVYTQILEKETSFWVKTTTLKMCSLLIDRFDLIFWLRPLQEIEDDGVRSLDIEFQKKVDNGFQLYFNLCPNLPVHQLTGNKEEYVSQFKQILNAKLKTR